ncbi:MAG: cytochrome-c peroxidase [Cyclobacteriaceae bacterium]|nr:cytochrome-c peroxidase [Cyclobacteriaceae bacterium]
MRRIHVLVGALVAVLTLLVGACKESSPSLATYPAIKATFGTKIDPDNLANYANQGKPSYILKDNTTDNPITDKGATLGRVLFYDVNLSKDNTISCGHCHKQQFAFSDTASASSGVNGFTGRHSMRLINSRFSAETKFFWDERAGSLENQTTQPVRDHKEMGFSGANGDPSIDDLVTKLKAIDYYQELFTMAYGNKDITEQRIKNALAQFIRSIQSFDTKFDAGRAMVGNDVAPFPNFTIEENQGKQLFIAPPQFDVASNRLGGGLGCQGCHRSPEFDIDPNTKNNGVIGVIGSLSADITNTRAPSLRNLLGTDGELITPAMHDASLTTLDAVIDHYNAIPLSGANTNLDNRLRPGIQAQKLQITAAERAALKAFLKTLSSNSASTDVRWSNPF